MLYVQRCESDAVPDCHVLHRVFIVKLLRCHVLAGRTGVLKLRSTLILFGIFRLLRTSCLR